MGILARLAKSWSNECEVSRADPPPPYKRLFAVAFLKRKQDAYFGDMGVENCCGKGERLFLVGEATTQYGFEATTQFTGFGNF